jgi:hypothetical protein
LAIDFVIGPLLTSTTFVDVYYVPGFDSVNSNGGVHYPSARAESLGSSTATSTRTATATLATWI